MTATEVQLSSLTRLTLRLQSTIVITFAAKIWEFLSIILKRKRK